MRTKLVVGNWKMNFTGAEATAVVKAFIRHVDAKSNVDVVICPSFVSLCKVRELVRDTHVKLGAQDVFWKQSGAYTGQVSAAMLYDSGAAFCIVGHSEMRGRFGKSDIEPGMDGYFSESDASVNLKIQALLYQSINPILCVGETLAERKAGQTEAVIRKQLEGAIRGVEPAELYFFVVAYEPVWAIGTGEVCDAEEANRVAKFIRTTLAELLNPEVVEEIRVLYGGSVKASNCEEIFAQPEIDGGLVGGASLDPKEFSRIVMSA
jgi:triosephosphate isomerase